MARSVEALINHELLVWARESLGISAEALAKKLKVDADTIASWERGDSKPSVVQLRKIGEACKRPLAVFYLSAKPKDFQPLKEYRRLHGSAEFRDTVALNLEIRQAEYRRQVALELSEELGEPSVKFPLHTKIGDDQEAVGLRIRQMLGIDFAQQQRWRDTNEALNRWRTAVERLGVLVFQVTSVATSELRGFSISHMPFPVIALNRKDAEAARIFTLIHELTHVMLNHGGICDIHEDYQRAPDEQRFEVFCNHVAGATIVPKSELMTRYIELKNAGQNKTLDDYLLTLSSQFKASREVILRRFLIMGWIAESTYEKKRHELMKEYAEMRERAKKSKKPVIITPPRNVLSTAGYPFVQLVLNGYQQEKITSRDLSDFLSMKVDHLPKLQAEFESKSVKFWAAKR